MSPATPITGDHISDIDLLPSPALLAGARFETDVPIGPVPGGYRTYGVSEEQLAAYLGVGLGPNAAKSLLKEFRFFRKSDHDADPDGGACFETDLDWNSCCAFTVCKIEFYREADTEPFRYQELVCVYDSAPTDPTHKVWADGSFSGLRSPGKFVLAESSYTKAQSDQQHADLQDYIDALGSDLNNELGQKQQQLNNHETRISDLENGAPVDLSAGNILWVEGAGQSTFGQRGNKNRPFRSVAEAAASAYGGDTVIVLPGGSATDALGRRCYPETVVLTNNVTVVCLPGAVISGIVNFGNFQGSQPYRIAWYGGIILNTFAVLRQTGGASQALIQGVRLEGLGYIQAYGGGSSGNYADLLDIRQLVARLGTGAAGAVLVSGRSDINQSQRIELTDYDLQTVDAPAIAFSGSYDPANGILSQVVLRGSGRLARTDGGATIVVNPTQPGGVAVPQADVIIDERPQGGGGAGYTDAQAVQAVNNAQVASKSIAVSGNNLEVKAKGITAGMLSQEVQDLISGGGVMTPLTNDTLFCHMADTADPLGFLKNLADGPDLRYGPGPASPLRVTPNALNGFPAVSFANNDSTQPDPSTYNTKYYGTAPAPGPATVTFLLRCNKAFDSSTDGKEISAGLLLNYPYATAASTGPALKLDNNFAIVTVIYTGLGRGQFFLNGRYLDTIAGSGFDLWPTGNDGGTFRLGLTFTGDLVAYIVSRDASRAAGRLHESYLNQKYNVY